MALAGAAVALRRGDVPRAGGAAAPVGAAAAFDWAGPALWRAALPLPRGETALPRGELAQPRASTALHSGEAPRSNAGAEFVFAESKVPSAMSAEGLGLNAHATLDDWRGAARPHAVSRLGAKPRAALYSPDVQNPGAATCTGAGWVAG